MGFFSNLYGSKPKVPELQRVSLADQQRAAIRANQLALPEAQELVGDTNRFSREQINQMLESVIPGYRRMTSTASSNIESMLKGEIPSDVSTQVWNTGVAKAFGTGMAGGGASRNLIARDLGLTSLDFTQRGLSSMDAWTRTMASIYEPGMMDIRSMFVNSLDMYNAENEQNLQQFQRQWMRNQIRAMPDPVLSGTFQDFQEIVRTAASTYAASKGGGMGGGGGGGSSPSTYENAYAGFGGGGFGWGSRGELGYAGSGSPYGV